MLDKNLKYEGKVDLDASVDDVFDAIINPVKIKKYFFDIDVNSSWEVGKEIIFEGAFGDQKFKDKGTILEFEEKKIVKYSYFSSFMGLEDLPENYSIVTYILERKEQSTHLKIEQIGFASEKSAQDSAGHWQVVLDGLKKLVENQG
jgi:uncharacterized protein YndB with AHSA1/START domain